MAPYLLGVDAGNSKTVALVASEQEGVVGAARGGPGDISHPETGVAAALDNIATTVTTALTRAGVGADGLQGRAFALAGADWPEDFALLRSSLGKHPWGRDAVIVNDALGALRAGSVDGLGVAVVGGTYATSAARAAGGASWHASFWQDGGGGFFLAQAAIKTVIRAELAIVPATSLTAAVLDFFERDTVEAVLHLLTARDASLPERELARLAPAVLDAADAGDLAARAIVRSQGEGLAEYALAAARRVDLGPEPFAVTLAGGIFRHPSTLLEDALAEHMRREVAGVQPQRSRLEPALGALMLALEHAGGSVGPELYARLAAWSPAQTLFET